MVKNDGQERQGLLWPFILAKVVIIRSEVTGRKVISKIMCYVVFMPEIVRPERDFFNRNLKT